MIFDEISTDISIEKLKLVSVTDSRMKANSVRKYYKQLNSYRCTNQEKLKNRYAGKLRLHFFCRKFPLTQPHIGGSLNAPLAFHHQKFLLRPAVVINLSYFS